jgi:hypothetical protein
MSWAASSQPWRTRLAAASLAFDPPAVVSHRSAAAWWSLEGFSEGPIEVTTSGNHRSIAGRVFRVSGFSNAQVKRHRGLLVTTPNQTLLDLGAVVDEERAAAALDSALLQGLTSLPHLENFLERFGGRGRRGAGVLRGLLERRIAGVRTESELERTFDRNVVQPGALPFPLFQHRIYEGDEFVARRDFVYPYEMLAIEVDGWRFHAGLEAWKRDLETDNRLIAMGWVVLRFTWEDICDRPQAVIQRIREVLEQRGQASLLNGREGKRVPPRGTSKD